MTATLKRRKTSKKFAEFGIAHGGVVIKITTRHKWEKYKASPSVVSLGSRLGDACLYATKKRVPLFDVILGAEVISKYSTNSPFQTLRAFFVDNKMQW